MVKWEDLNREKQDEYMNRASMLLAGGYIIENILSYSDLLHFSPSRP